MPLTGTVNLPPGTPMRLVFAPRIERQLRDFLAKVTARNAHGTVVEPTAGLNWSEGVHAHYFYVPEGPAGRTIDAGLEFAEAVETITLDVIHWPSRESFDSHLLGPAVIVHPATREHSWITSMTIENEG
ncbi:hypothetical protein [Luteococcus sp.]|uniref:hypothetical protein n=1 Tax=Luteococcus sp. TaxID=1969402 RepID=UPI0037366D40